MLGLQATYHRRNFRILIELMSLFGAPLAAKKTYVQQIIYPLQAIHRTKILMIIANSDTIRSSLYGLLASISIPYT